MRLVDRLLSSDAAILAGILLLAALGLGGLLLLHNS